MWSERYFYHEVVPFAAVVLLQFTTVGLATLFKAAASQGLSSQVFLFYSYALSGLLLLPFAYIFDRNKQLPPINLSFLGRVFILGLIGYSFQMMGYKGIEYSSPTLGSVMSNLSPAITFVFAVIFRMEKIDMRMLSSRVKIIGTIVSVSGAFVVVLYKGPAIIRSLSLLSSEFHQPLKSEQSDWIIGGVLLAGGYTLMCIWYIAQAHTVRKYPAELLVVSLYNLSAAVVATPVALLMEKDYSALRINSTITLIAILYSALVEFSSSVVILTWGLRVKGPVYVAIFHPLAIVIAAFCSVVFLGESLYLGSIVGAVIICIGFYMVIWGKAKEDNADETEDVGGSLESSILTTETAMPLLH